MLKCEILLTIFFLSTSSYANDGIRNYIYFHNIIAESEMSDVCNALTGHKNCNHDIKKYSTDGSLYISYYDFNDDGSKEIIIIIADPMLCGSAGCQSIIAEKRNGQYHIIAETSGLTEYFEVSSKKDCGWKRFSTGKGDFGYWIGDSYFYLDYDYDEKLFGPPPRPCTNQ